MAEQAALDQLVRDGGQVDRHERRGLPIAVLVDVAREHLLAGTALAGDEHGDGLGGELLRRLRQHAHRLRAAENHRLAIAARLLLAQPRQLAGRLELVERLHHPRVELGRREVLGHVVDGAEAHGLDRDGDLLHHGDHDDADVGVLLADLAQHLEARHARHLHVEEHHVDGAALERPQRLFAGSDGDGEHTRVADDGLHRLPHAAVVVGDEDCRCSSH